MNLIKKEKLFPIICISYTIISLSLTILEAFKRKSIYNELFNLILMFVWTSIAVIVLSQNYRFARQTSKKTEK